MAAVNMHEAKTHLSRLVERAEAGEEVVMARAGKRVAKLVPFVDERAPRTPAGCEGGVGIAPDLDELPADVRAAFEGRGSCSTRMPSGGSTARSGWANPRRTTAIRSIGCSPPRRGWRISRS
jgi:prevent-host-death family protein